MTRLRVLTAILLTCVFISSLTAQERTRAQQGKPLPLDPAVTTGKLKNGMTYFIRHNGKPSGRIELRLAVNAGSILEDNDQQGLAHFTEHMCFNGTEHFKKQELVSFMESIGMRFGGDVNASTSFDETTYMLQVPTDKPEVLDRAFQIMEDWAHYVSLEGDEIDKERGVIIEEWRQGRGADSRIRDHQYAVMYKNSRYAQRLPIGKKEVLESFKHETLRRFYKEWYRPDLMAIAVAGDLDIATMEQLVRKHFESIPATPNPRGRDSYTVPEFDQTRYAIAFDPEATRSNVSIVYQQPAQSRKSREDFRRDLVEELYNSMFNARLREIAQKADPPFISAGSYSGRSIRPLSTYTIMATTREGGIATGLEAIATEAERVRRFGFAATELARVKKEVTRSYESAVKEKDKTESRDLVRECVRYFLYGEVMPGVDVELALVKEFMPGISLEELNAQAEKFMPERNMVVSASGPSKDGSNQVDEAALASAIERARGTKLSAYVDKTTEKPLVPAAPKAGTVLKEREIPELGATEWTLSNGVHVILKPTDFKNDEVLLSAVSPGGTSLVPVDQLIHATLASSVVNECGLGEFSQTDLRKHLAGQVVRVTPLLRELFEGMQASASPQDMETMFKLIYLTFTAPRSDTAAFRSLVTRLKGMLHNRSAQPESALEDTTMVTISGYNPRRVPMSEERLAGVDLESSLKIFRDRFQDASDFTFTIVGSFTKESIRPLIEAWLGGLVSTKRQEAWRDPNVCFPQQPVVKEVRKGIEKKSAVRSIIQGPFTWTSEQRFAFNAMVEILRIKLREAVREEKGGTYGVGVMGNFDKFPTPRYTIAVSFGCNPDRVPELLSTVDQVMAALRDSAVEASYLDKVKEQMKRQRETRLKENSFWVSALEQAAMFGEDPREMLQYVPRVEAISLKQVQEAAKKYLPVDKGVRVILYPESK
jgi:zinc protease